jgi:hypothetical protein
MFFNVDLHSTMKIRLKLCDKNREQVYPNNMLGKIKWGKTKFYMVDRKNMRVEGSQMGKEEDYYEIPKWPYSHSPLALKNIIKLFY